MKGLCSKQLKTMQIKMADGHGSAKIVEDSHQASLLVQHEQNQSDYAHSPHSAVVTTDSTFNPIDSNRINHLNNEIVVLSNTTLNQGGNNQTQLSQSVDLLADSASMLQRIVARLLQEKLIEPSVANNPEV